MADRRLIAGIITALIAAATAIAVALINRPSNHAAPTATVIPGQTPVEAQPSPSSTVFVDANGWTNTGIVVGAGQEILIQATGSWTTWGEHQEVRPMVGPAGYAGNWDREIVEGHSGWNYEDFKRALLLPSAPSGALIGKIAGSVFLVGPSIHRTAPEGGDLLLGCNDVDANNLGSMTVKISVK